MFHFWCWWSISSRGTTPTVSALGSCTTLGLRQSATLRLQWGGGRWGPFSIKGGVKDFKPTAPGTSFTSTLDYAALSLHHKSDRQNSHNVLVCHW